MPFDGTDYRPERPEPHPGAPSDNVVSALIIALAAGLRILPISLTAFIDLVRYVRGG